MNKPSVVIFAAVALDAVGIGLIFPILPRLIKDVMHAGNVASYIGILTALYAAMQFVFAPVLGALSDRLGRRPVLLISLGGAAVNYMLMAIAPSLWLLFVGRAIAGLTSANISVATAYITDISAEETRAKRLRFATQGWVVFAIMPVVALAGIGMPALQSLATRQVDESRQGQFQGVLASAMSLASSVGPLVFSSFYFVVREKWPGAIWLLALVVNVIAVPLVFKLSLISELPGQLN